MKSAVASPQVRLMIALRSAHRATLDAVARRFALEFGSGVRPEPPAYEGSDGGRRLWLAPEAEIPAASLPALADHGRRVEALYRGARAAGEIAIEFGCRDERTVARAVAEAGPGRIYIGDGWWGEPALLLGDDGQWTPTPWASPEWRDPRLAAWLREVRERRLSGESPDDSPRGNGDDEGGAEEGTR